jgi:hypothetical protein
MSDVETIQKFIDYNQPILDDIKDTNPQLGNAVRTVVTELFAKYIGVPIKEETETVEETETIETNYSKLSLEEINDKIESAKELIELYDDPEDSDQIEAEAELLELELELENRK